MASKVINSLICLITIHNCYGSSILGFFPFPIPSHHRAYQPVLKGLLDRGHHVTYFSPFPLSDSPQDKINYTEIIIPDFMPIVKQKMQEISGFSEEDMKHYLTWIPQSVMMMMSRPFGLLMGEMTLKDDKFRGLISSEMKFDCILYSGSFMQEMYSALSHRFQAPLIEVLPSGNMHYTYWLHGNPYDTSYIVDFSVAKGDRMSLWERIQNTLSSLLLRSFWYIIYWPKYQQLMNEHFRYPGWETRPPLEELVGKTSMVLMNTHYSLNYAYPLSPNFKEIGGINIVQPKPLPKDLQEFMDSSDEGVIYFSLGSHINASSIFEGGLLEAYVKAFSQIKQKVLWKMPEDVPNLSSNVKTDKWLPQQAILNHKNCKVFMTHGGFLSLAETIYYGVPLVGTPLLADQLRNIRHMELNEYGVQLSLSNITEQSIVWAIQEVLGNPRYTEKIQKQSELFRDKPETALETAVYWTEYVIRHKGAHHLRPAIATMPWYQQAMIDVYLTIALIIFIPLYVSYKILKCICSCLRSGSKNPNKKKKD